MAWCYKTWTSNIVEWILPFLRPISLLIQYDNIEKLATLISNIFFRGVNIFVMKCDRGGRGCQKKSKLAWRHLWMPPKYRRLPLTDISLVNLGGQLKVVDVNYPVKSWSTSVASVDLTSELFTIFPIICENHPLYICSYVTICVNPLCIQYG